MLSFERSRAIHVAGIFILVMLLSSVGEARNCSSLFTAIPDVSIASVRENISAEFSSIPDDARNGFVTDTVPVTADTVIRGYQFGVFPWRMTPEGNGVWFNPPKRGILSLDLNIRTSDRKDLRRLEAAVERGELRVSFDEAFEQVMRACATQPRLVRNPVTLELDSAGTWITEEIIQGYSTLAKSGKAHSVEIWRGTELVGGMYGVLHNGVFTGESMFHTMPDVAKLALSRIAQHLKSRGFEWMDTQVAIPGSTSLSVKWGAVEIPRELFQIRQREAQARGLTW